MGNVGFGSNYFFIVQAVSKMNEILLLSSNKESCGMGVIDVATGSMVCNSFKNCIADSGTMCSVGSSSSSYSGQGSGGDYIAVAQSKKPVLNIWQWGKPQPLFQCHIQEIMTSLTSDSTGTFLLGGTRKGWIYCWNLSTGELVNIWQAHFKTVTKLQMTKNGQFCVSVSEDGMGRAWDMSRVLDITERARNVGGKQTITPYKSWSAHTLAVKDMYLIDSPGLLRVVTCAMDRTVVMYDVHAGKQVLRISLPHSLESIACNPGEDVLCVGSTNGTVFLVDLAVTAIAVSAAHSQVATLGGPATAAAVPSLLRGAGALLQSAKSGAAASGASQNLMSGRAESSSVSTGGLPKGTSVLEGHTKAVTSLCFSADNTTLVSASEDSTVRMWDVWTRQCTKECRPLNKCSITNALLLIRPEVLGTGVVKPSLCPVAHLKKYMEAATNATADEQGNPTVVLGAALLSNHDALRGGATGLSTEAAVQTRRRQGLAPSASAAAEHSAAESTADSKGGSEGSLKRKRGGHDDDVDAEVAVVVTEKPVAAAKVEEHEEEDFLSFSTKYDESEHQHSFSDEEVDEEGEGEGEGDSSALLEQLRVAEEKIALLQQQNVRWEGICARLKDHIAVAASTTTAKDTVVAADGQELEDEEQDVDSGDNGDESAVKDVGDSAEVVERIRSTNSGSKGKKTAAKSAGGKKAAAPAEEEPAWETVGNKKRKLASTTNAAAAVTPAATKDTKRKTRK